jgi:hypothetical protein
VLKFGFLLQMSDYSHFNESYLSLYVYESVELDISFNTVSKKPFDYPILLESDPTSPARYFCSHKAGVHAVGLPMVTRLAEMARMPDNDATISALEKQVIINAISL